MPITEQHPFRPRFYLEGHPAEPLARYCFSKLRFLPAGLKGQLRREGLWHDLVHELYTFALESWRENKTPHEVSAAALTEIRNFLQAYGYVRYRREKGESIDGHCRWIVSLADVSSEDDELAERVLAGAQALPTTENLEGLEQALIRYIKGCARRRPDNPPSLKEACQTLKQRARAGMVAYCCDRLVVRGVLVLVPQPRGRGQRPSPLLVLVEPDSASPAPEPAGVVSSR